VRIVGFVDLDHINPTISTSTEMVNIFDDDGTNAFEIEESAGAVLRIPQPFAWPLPCDVKYLILISNPPESH
jgi:hypothetical protein